MSVSSSLKQNQVPTSVDMQDLGNLWQKQFGLALNCHAIGQIQSFNAVNQTATVTISYKRAFFKLNEQTNEFEPSAQDYPVLLDVPVVVLGGGGYSLTFPITVGDECLVLFNDRDIDNWFTGAVSGGLPATPRLHSLADGIALVGIRSQAKVIQDYDTDSVALRNLLGTIKIKLKASSVEIAVGPTMTFEVTTAGKLSVTNALGEFVDALNTILTTATAGGFPLVVDPVALAVFQSFKA